jgi:tRNA(Ile)-lysidine synthase
MEGSADVRGIAAARGLSLETAGRRERHRFFAACARKVRSRTVFLAHHADDQIETILANLLRGSSGLRGMEPVSSLLPPGCRKPLTLCRPLLGLTRAELSAWATARKIRFREDASNAVPDTFRNRLRLEAIPALRSAAGRDFRPALLRAAAMASEDHAFLGSLAKPFAAHDQLSVPELQALPPALRRHVLHCWLQHHQIPDCGFREVAALATLLDPSQPPRINLPGNHQAGRSSRRLWIRHLP